MKEGRTRRRIFRSETRCSLAGFFRRRHQAALCLVQQAPDRVYRFIPSLTVFWFWGDNLT